MAANVVESVDLPFAVLDGKNVVTCEGELDVFTSLREPLLHQKVGVERREK